MKTNMKLGSLQGSPTMEPGFCLSADVTETLLAGFGGQHQGETVEGALLPISWSTEKSMLSTVIFLAPLQKTVMHACVGTGAKATFPGSISAM